MNKASGATWRSFRSGAGAREHTIAIEAPADLDLPRQLDAVARAYAEATQALNLPQQTGVFRRIFASDIANQSGQIRESSLFKEPYDSPVAVSLVQQPPLSGAKVAMLAYHIDGDGPLVKTEIAPGHVLVQRGELGHLWSTRLCPGDETGPSGAADQTRAVFDALISTLEARGGGLADNCVRTWLYLKQVDVFYQDLVAARRELFERHGLNRDTHYIASTGIEGACAHRYDVVLMDAYSILGLRPEQVSYLNDLDRLCETKDYGVTFERGTRVAFADRAHHLISGTASIDAAGQVVHVGDVERQLERAMENIDHLLRSGGARIEDMTHFIVYLRDASDRPRIAGYFAERFPDTPCVIVRGPVCRPEWLVEVEGIAAVAHHAPTLPAF
jgi:enamine deaminase RidA (YjgF/YER057c/UK114 family)